MGTTSDIDVSDSFDYDGGGTSLRSPDARIKRGITKQLYSEPWGHVEHCDTDCTCLSSDRTASYVHGLLPMPWVDESTSKNDDRTSVETEDNVVVDNDCGYLGVGRPGSVPFVSHRPGAYGRLLLAVYVRWKTGLLGLLVYWLGLLVYWFRPVTRGAWRAVLPDRVRNPDPVRGPVGTS